MLQVRCQGMMLHQIADVSNVRYTRRWDAYEGRWCGPVMASWQWAADMSVTPGFLRRLARVEILDGGTVVWGGYVDQVERDSGFRVVASGWGKLLDDFLSMIEHGDQLVFPGGEVPTYNLDVGFDYAKLQFGTLMPLTRVGSLGEVTVDLTKNPDPLTLAQGLALRAKNLGRYVHVDEWGYVRLVESIGDVYGERPPIGLDPDVKPRMGSVDTAYYSTLYGYGTFDTDGTPGGPTFDVAFKTRNADAGQQWGEKQRWIDYRKWGALTTTGGLGMLLGDLGERFNQVGARLQFLDRVLGDKDTLRLLGCGPILPTEPREGEVLRAFGAADADGNAMLGSFEEFTIGELDYDEMSEVVALTPVGFVPRDIAGIVANPVDPATGPHVVGPLETA